MTERLDKQLPRHLMQSTLVRDIGWRQIPYDNDPMELGVLEVGLTDGNLYRYYDVPKAVYEALLDAPSVGALFGQIVRNTFPYAHIRKIRKAG